MDRRDAGWLADQKRQDVEEAADLAMSLNESGHLILQEWTAAVRRVAALRHESLMQEQWNQQIVMPPPTPMGEPWDERSR